MELRKDRFESRLQEVGNSGIEIDPENDAQWEEDQVSEIGAVSHLESETLQMKEMGAEKEGPIIKPKRRAESSSSVKK